MLYLVKNIFIMEEVAQKFKVGDVVKLKSGSPTMTVSKLDFKLRIGGANSGKLDKFFGMLDCQWFVNTELKTASFNQDTLESITL